MLDAAKIHDDKYRRAKAEGLPGWGGFERVLRLPQILEERFFAFEGAPISGRCLELGCGAGNLSLALAARGFDVCGVDFAESAIAWAHENARQAGRNIDFRVADVTDLSLFKDETFDVVYDGNCLHCIVGEKRASALSEWKRILKDDGILFVSSLCALPQDPSFPDEFDPVSRILVEDGIPYRYIPTADGLVSELVRRGFFVEHQVQRHESPFAHINIHARKA